MLTTCVYSSITGIASTISGSSCTVAIVSMTVSLLLNILFFAGFGVLLGVYTFRKTSPKSKVQKQTARDIDCEKYAAYTVITSEDKALPARKYKSELKCEKNFKCKGARDVECKSDERFAANFRDVGVKTPKHTNRNDVSVSNDFAAVKKNTPAKYVDCKKSIAYELVAVMNTKKYGTESLSMSGVECRENKALGGGIATGKLKKNKTNCSPVPAVECRENKALGGGIATGQPKKNKYNCSPVPAVECRENIAYGGGIATGRHKKNKTNCSPVPAVECRENKAYGGGIATGQPKKKCLPAPALECRENKAYGGIGAGYKVIREVDQKVSSDVSVSPNEPYKLHGVFHVCK